MFVCYKCPQEFDNIESIFIHLKKHHSLRNNVEKLKCVRKNSNCGKSYTSFNSLRRHLNECESSNADLIRVKNPVFDHSIVESHNHFIALIILDK